MASFDRDHNDPSAAIRFHNRLTAAFIAIPLLAFGGWWLAAEQPWVKQKDGGYNCLTAEGQRLKELSKQQGVPHMHDPRPGREWYARFEQGELTEVSDVTFDMETNDLKTATPRSYRYSERLSKDQFTASIDGTTFTCTHSESD